MAWPERGVYFFFEPGEQRDANPSSRRVVRVGTHALIPNARSTLWKRLSQHRGTNNPRGGNHRGSIFRLLIGEALLNAETSLTVASWGQGSTATRDIRNREREHEIRVSDYLSNMTLLFVDVPDAPGPDSARGIIERNSIALLGNYDDPALDQPHADWLGHHSGHERIRRSGLWNNNHVDEAYDPSFLDLFADLVRHMATVRW